MYVCIYLPPYGFHKKLMLTLTIPLHNTEAAVYVSGTVRGHGSPIKKSLLSGANMQPLYLHVNVDTYPSTYLHLSYLSIYLSIYLSTYLPIYLFTYLPIHLSTYLSIYLSICLCICLCIYVSNLPSFLYVCLCIYLSSCLSIYLSIYLFISNSYTNR